MLEFVKTMPKAVVIAVVVVLGFLAVVAVKEFVMLAEPSKAVECTTTVIDRVWPLSDKTVVKCVVR